MGTFSSRKRWAVWVMIAGLATAISAWAIELAGSQILQSDLCVVCPLERDPCKFDKRKVLDFEVGKESRLDGTEKSLCIQGWLKASVKADFLLIPSYSALMALIFFLLAEPDRKNRSVPLAWVAVGIILAALMLAADTAENVLLLSFIQVRQVLPLLLPATVAKWGAVALASVLAGVLALDGGYERGRWKRVLKGIMSKPRRWYWTEILVGLIGLVGLATGAIIAVGLAIVTAVSRQSTAILDAGTLKALPLFFLLMLIYAIVVVVRPDAVDLNAPVGEGVAES
jgi:hypothetical protein